MADEKKSGEELLEEPFDGFSDTSGTSDMRTPFDSTIDLLATTQGEHLELMTRATPQLAQAASVAYNIRYTFGSRYMGAYIEQLMRFAVSIGGKGRQEVVDSLRAGSGVPDSYYEVQSGNNQGFTEE